MRVRKLYVANTTQRQSAPLVGLSVVIPARMSHQCNVVADI